MNLRRDKVSYSVVVVLDAVSFSPVLVCLLRVCNSRAVSVLFTLLLLFGCQLELKGMLVMLVLGPNFTLLL